MGKSDIKSKIGHLLEWEGGQRLFNFAYSIGAAIVIWGALFHILHLPGGNTLLCIGMGTEVLMFVITAFDRPPKDSAGTNNSAVSSGVRGEGESFVVGGSDLDLHSTDSQVLAESIKKMSAAAEQLSKMAELTTATQNYLNQMAAIASQMEQLRHTTESLNAVSMTLLDSYKAITENSAAITENSQGYVEKMNDLNRNLGGLNTIYEIQLKSVSSQLDSIERVNLGIKDIRDMYEKSAAQSARYCEETEKMARYMQQLNRMYEKTLDTMTMNICRPVVDDMR